jgi:hypothetical protein
MKEGDINNSAAQTAFATGSVAEAAWQVNKFKKAIAPSSGKTLPSPKKAELTR